MTLNQTTNHHTKRILWAFGLECALFIVILLFLDSAPTWILRISAILAVALPIVCYLTIATQASVYRSWLNMAQELRCALVAGVRCLWHCLTLKNARELVHRIAKMKAFPFTADDWFALMLFPFKAYVLAAIPFLWTCRAVDGLFWSEHAHMGWSEAWALVVTGYIPCLSALLGGALIQALFSTRGRSTQTVIVFLIGLFMFWALWP